MPKHTFDAKAESLEFTLLPDGDYTFEVLSIDTSIRNSGKTSGSDEVEMKCAFYKDAKFEKKIAQWTESLIFHESIAWKISVFTKCANILVDGKVPGDGAELDYCAETMVGLRGWATVRTKAGTKDPTKKFNYVAVWLTNKEKLARNTPEVDPFADEEKEPF